MKKLRKGKIVFESIQHTVCLFPGFMTIQNNIKGCGHKMMSFHPQFQDWSTAFDDLDSVSEGDRLCRGFLK